MNISAIISFKNQSASYFDIWYCFFSNLENFKAIQNRLQIPNRSENRSATATWKEKRSVEHSLYTDVVLFFFSLAGERASEARARERARSERKKNKERLFSSSPMHPFPLALADNKSPAVFIFIRALDDFERENHGSSLWAGYVEQNVKLKRKTFFIVICGSIVCLAPSVSFYLHVSQTNYSFRMPIFRKTLG